MTRHERTMQAIAADSSRRANGGGGGAAAASGGGGGGGAAASGGVVARGLPVPQPFAMPLGQTTIFGPTSVAHRGEGAHRSRPGPPLSAPTSRCSPWYG